LNIALARTANRCRGLGALDAASTGKIEELFRSRGLVRQTRGEGSGFLKPSKRVTGTSTRGLRDRSQLPEAQGLKPELLGVAGNEPDGHRRQACLAAWERTR